MFILGGYAAASVEKYRYNFRHGENDHSDRCAVTPSGLGVMVGLTIGLSAWFTYMLFIILMINKNDEQPDNETTKDTTKDTTNDTVQYYITGGILVGGFAVLVGALTYYTWYSKCFYDNYVGTYVLNTMITIILCGSLVDFVGIILIVSIAFKLLCYDVCKSTYKYIMYGNEETQQNANQIVAESNITETNINSLVNSLMDDSANV